VKTAAIQALPDQQSCWLAKPATVEIAEASAVIWLAVAAWTRSHRRKRFACPTIQALR